MKLTNRPLKYVSDFEIELFLKQLGIIKCAECFVLIISTKCICVDGPSLLVRYTQEAWNKYWEPFETPTNVNIPFKISLEKYLMLNIDDFDILSISQE